MSVYRSGLFAGKVALVTGGGTGIGKGITQELLGLGCKVMIASRNPDKLSHATKELSRFGSIASVQCNIRKEEDTETAVKETLDKFGQVDFLVNNGGGQFPALAKDIKLKGWNAVVETNLTGTFLMSKAAYNQYFSEHGGSIVNIIADHQRGIPYMAHTGAARAGAENLTKTLATEWAASGVRINAVAPGPIFSQTASDNYEHDIFGKYGPKLPLKRCGTVEEVSSTVCFLLSPGSSFITGSTVQIDGGAFLYSSLQLDNIPMHDKHPGYTWQEEEEK